MSRRVRRKEKTKQAQKQHEERASSAGAIGQWLASPAVRETIESIAVALILAVLFRTFEAEAFVIPTGSMAPTLLGQHKDVTCPVCGTFFEVSASRTFNNESGRPNNWHVVGAVCPNCRYPISLAPNNPQHETYPTYKGDRILVIKFPYQFGRPKRWDVAVFKYPGSARTSFIKRVVGLPNETILISHGDIFVKPLSPQDFQADHPIKRSEYQIARKPPRKVRALLQLVYDNNHVPRRLLEVGWPPRWAPLSPQPEHGGWQTNALYTVFSTNGSAAGAVWLGYRHLVPTPEDWANIMSSGTVRTPIVQPQLISDFAGYNTDVLDTSTVLSGLGWQSQSTTGLAASLPQLSMEQMGLHWVGDLALECTFQPKQLKGELWFELVEGGRRMRARFDLESASVRLQIEALAQYNPSAKVRLKENRQHRVLFANVDNQLLLWLDGKLIRFDQPTQYPLLDNERPTREDLIPARIASDQAPVTVSNLKLYRDIYYIAVKATAGMPSAETMSDFVTPPILPWTPESVPKLLRDPSTYARAQLREVRFPLADDQYLVLGDNSAESMDSRLWEKHYFEYYVRSDLLIGKALVIFFPHPLKRIPGTKIPVPFFPNFSRMRLIR